VKLSLYCQQSIYSTWLHIIDTFQITSAFEQNMKCNLTHWHISRAISTVHVVLYNNCLHMRWTLKVVNARALAQGKITSQWSTIWCSSHMKAITISLNWNYSNMFITWMFCFAEDNKIISGIENTIMEPDWKNTEFQYTSSCQGLSPSTLYMLWLLTGLSPSSTKFPKNILIILLDIIIPYILFYYIKVIDNMENLMTRKQPSGQPKHIKIWTMHSFLFDIGDLKVIKFCEI
jgi:hypothetical protein